MSLPATDSGDNTIKGHVCPYCKREFARFEHVQRHIRRHTKEKPFQCQICPKRFTRSDLLKRHEAIAHLEGRSEQTAMASTESGVITQAPHVRTSPEPSHPSFSTIHLGIPLEINDLRSVPDSGIEINGNEIAQLQHHSPSRCSESPIAMDPDQSLFDQLQPYQFEEQGTLIDFTELMDEMGPAEEWNMVGLVSPQTEIPGTQDMRIVAPQISGSKCPDTSQVDGPDENGDEFSQFSSRLPSLQPEPPDDFRLKAVSIKPTRQPWTVTRTDYQHFVDNLNGFEGILVHFQFPTKETMARLLSGYFQGFDEHLPFVHRSTFTAQDAAPELVLALCTIGARYRLEEYRCLDLFYAAKSVAMAQIQQRDLRRTARGSTAYMRLATGRAFCSFDQDLNTSQPPRSQMKVQSLQAILLLMAFASWQTSFLHEALSLQSAAARLVRDLGLSTKTPEDLTSWEDWVQYETSKRTKFGAYTLFNQQTLAFNTPPLLRTEELNLFLPCTEKLWTASTVKEWEQLNVEASSESAFQDLLIGLFDKDLNFLPSHVTPFGNYVLIQAVLQHIYYVRSAQVPRLECERRMSHEAILTIDLALRKWKSLWSLAPSSKRGLDPTNPDGPIAFTSTALLGLAYIRTHCDNGPIRHLDMQDPILIAQSLLNASAPPQLPQLFTALRLSVHALSIPVKLGVNFVAQTQTLFWSIQHAIFSMECALLLSKWLLSLPLRLVQDSIPMSKREEHLVVWLYRVVQETEFALKQNASLGDSINRKIAQDSSTLRNLAVAVVKIWAMAFKGSSKWQIVDLIGKGLDKYADMLVNTLEQPN